MKLLLIDDDPIFRLGFCAALGQETDWAIAAESFETILGETPRRGIQIILCDPAWHGDRHWLRYRELQAMYGGIPIVLLTSQLDTERIFQAKRDGIAGYLLKGMAIAELVPELENILAGGKAWSKLPKGMNQNILGGMRRRGLNDIYTALETVEMYLSNAELSQFYRLIFEGQQRELQAAAWVVKKLLPQSYVILETSTKSQQKSASKNQIIPAPPVAISTTNSRWQNLLEETFIKLNGNLNNATKIIFELDILSPEKRRELFYIILQQLNLIFNDPQWEDLVETQFTERQQRSLRNLWKFSTQEFMSRYSLEPDIQSEPFLDQLNRQAIAVHQEILQHIPHHLDLFAYLLKDQALVIDHVTYRTEARESLDRAQILLENLIISLANSILEYVLNTFGESEIFKHQLYNAKIRSSREIARFRNDLSWQYRLQKYWFKPKAIFESRYQLMTLNATGIQRETIYAPRYQELDNLQGIAWGVTMILELRDALAPRIRALVAWLGEIVVYLLTNVIGRALGLIARGISDGVGTSWQSVRGK